MSQETEIALLTHKVESLHEDMSEMKVVMRDIAAALTKLAIIDERQAQMNEAQDRIFSTLKSHDIRIGSMEKDDGRQQLAIDWVFRSVWAFFGICAMYALKLIGLV